MTSGASNGGSPLSSGLDWGAVLRPLYRGPRGNGAAVVNPYRDEVPGLDRPGGARQRRRNLEGYLERVGEPRWILLGEALGFRGGRFSGIAFTSERQLAGAAERRLPWCASAELKATSRNPALWLEPSGSIVWGALGGEPRGVLLWNAFPWHPHRQRTPLSNRRPETALLEANLELLAALLALAAPARPLAVGRTAHQALALLAVEAPLLRHPAHGGARHFRSDLAALLGADLAPGRRAGSAPGPPDGPDLALPGER
jgi:hypothetical protein